MFTMFVGECKAVWCFDRSDLVEADQSQRGAGAVAY